MQHFLPANPDKFAYTAVSPFKTISVSIVLAIALSGLTANAEPTYQLSADKQGWGDAGNADLTKVLRSSCDAIAQHLGETKLAEPIRVRHDAEGPITLFRRTVRGEIIVELSSRDLFWCQHAYQMAHEFCHVLCKFREGGRDNLWFEESLCELASMFALRSMADSWKTKPPYPNWKSYADSIRDYVADLEKKHSLPESQTAAAYYREHAEHLKKSPTDRLKNGTIALALLPHFEKHPQAWQSLRHLNSGRGKDNLPFSEHLKNWHDECPEKHRSFVKDLAGQLGIKF